MWKTIMKGAVDITKLIVTAPFNKSPKESIPKGPAQKK
jgi:hypothetical protein